MNKLIAFLLTGTLALAVCAAPAKPPAKPAGKPAPKAAAKPAAKPAPKAAAKPAPKPVAKPAPKPAARPAAKPAPKPAGPRAPKMAKTPKKVVHMGRPRTMTGFRHDMNRLFGPDRRLAEMIEDAETLHELRRFMQNAVSARSPEVRLTMIDALEDIGVRAIGDLAYFLCDPDEEVAQSAFSAWSSLLEDVRAADRAFAIQATSDLLRNIAAQRGWQCPEYYQMPVVVAP